MRSPAGEALLYFFEPVEDHLELRRRGGAGLRLAGGDDSEKMFAVGKDVEVPYFGCNAGDEGPRERRQGGEGEAGLEGHAHIGNGGTGSSDVEDLLPVRGPDRMPIVVAFAGDLVFAGAGRVGLNVDLPGALPFAILIREPFAVG